MNSSPSDTPGMVRGYSGKIPVAAIIALEKELFGLEHGVATLAFNIRDGKLARFTTGRETSHLAPEVGGDDGE